MTAEPAAVPVGGHPYAVAVDPAAGTVYVTDEGNDTVSVIDAATGTVTAAIPVGTAPDGVGWSCHRDVYWPTSAMARCR